jgi:hypothetical protein
VHARTVNGTWHVYGLCVVLSAVAHHALESWREVRTLGRARPSSVIATSCAVTFISCLPFAAPPCLSIIQSYYSIHRQKYTYFSCRVLKIWAFDNAWRRGRKSRPLVNSMSHSLWKTKRSNPFIWKEHRLPSLHYFFQTSIIKIFCKESLEGSPLLSLIHKSAREAVLGFHWLLYSFW